MRNFTLIIVSLITLSNHNSQAQIDYDKQINFFFSDFDIIMNGNSEGLSFGDIIIKFDGQDLGTDNYRIEVVRGNDGNIIRKFGSSYILHLTFNRFMYVTDDDLKGNQFFPLEENTFTTARVDKIYYGIKKDFELRPNIFKIVTIFSKTGLSNNDFDEFNQRVKNITEQKLSDKNYSETSFAKRRGVNLDKFDSEYFTIWDYNSENGKKRWALFKMPLMKSTLYTNRDIIEGIKEVSDYKYPLSQVYLGNNIINKGKLYVTIMDVRDFFTNFEVIDKKEKKFMINDNDIRDINVFQLEDMVNVFLDDCQENNIPVNRNQNIYVEFVSLEDSKLAVAYGIDDDNTIAVRVDPIRWEKASLSKKWYLMYHELGHDVLNLRHGDGGKMMFNYSESDYSWDDFFEEKSFMFDVYKKKNNISDIDNYLNKNNKKQHTKKGN